MKTLVKFTFLTLVLAAATLPAFSAAKDDSTPAPADHPRLHALMKHRAALRTRVARRLGLNADQIAQLKAKRATTVASLRAIRSDASLTADQKKAKAHETLKAAREEMRTVLTPDQQAKLKQIHGHLQKARKARKSA